MMDRKEARRPASGDKLVGSDCSEKNVRVVPTTSRVEVDRITFDKLGELAKGVEILSLGVGASGEVYLDDAGAWPAPTCRVETGPSMTPTHEKGTGGGGGEGG